MLVSFRDKFVYVGINKTATTTIEAVLKPRTNRLAQKYYKVRHQRLCDNKPAFKHMPAKMARDLIGRRRWEAYFTFTFVRNPWARVLSEYTAHDHQGGSVLEGFHSWVKNGGNWLARENNMKRFVTDEHGQCLVDFIGRVESLEQDLTSVIDRKVLSFDLRHRNVSAQKIDLSEAFTPEIQSIVYDWIREDLEYFDYPQNIPV